MGLPGRNANFGDSFNSAREIAFEARVRKEMEFWLSSAGLIQALAMYGLKYRRDPKEKKKARRLLLWMLERCVSADFDVELTPEGENVAFEQIEEGEDECDCVRQYMNTMESLPEGTPYHKMLHQMLMELDSWVDVQVFLCPVLAMHYGTVLRKLQGHIDGRWEEWGSRDWVKTAAANVASAEKGSRRMDTHVKQYVSEHKKHRTSHGAAQSLDTPPSSGSVARWEADQVAAHRCETMMQIVDINDLSGTWDGIRAGNPSKDWLIWALTELNSEISSVGMPVESIFY